MVCFNCQTPDEHFEGKNAGWRTLFEYDYSDEASARALLEDEKARRPARIAELQDRDSTGT